MRAEAIFAPMSVLAVFTGAVLMMTGGRRILAVRARRVTAQAFRLGESKEVPEEVAVTNRNLMNLLEMPMLFYVACLSLYVTHVVNRNVVVLAWAYVGLRVLHSLIHLTTNRVTHRLFAFALSNVVLIWLWVTLIVRVL